MTIADDYRIYPLRDPDYWGPHFWKFLYLSALGLPITLSEIQSQQFEQLIKNYHAFLPCIECRYHYYHAIKDKRLTFRRREDVLAAILDIHNTVRRRLNKSEITIESLINYLHRDYYSTQTRPYMRVEYVMLVMGLVVVLLLYRKNHKIHS